MSLKMKLKPIALLISLMASPVVANERPTDKLLLKFDRLIQGEFDNYNQVNFESNEFLTAQDVPEQRHARLYQRIVKIEAPQLGDYVYYQQVHDGGKDKAIYRQALLIAQANHTNRTIVVKNFKFNNPKAYKNLWSESEKALTLADLNELGSGCDSIFHSIGNGFKGGINQDDCVIKTSKGSEIHIATEQLINEDEFWHLEEGYSANNQELFGREDNVPHKLKRARDFKCWAAFKTEKLKANGEHEWDFFADRIVHDQGDIAQFTTTDENPKSYFIRLKQTEFPAGNRPDVFEMFIHEDSEQAKKNYKQALSYTWTNKEAERLGINLRWMQSSCSLIK